MSTKPLPAFLLAFAISSPSHADEIKTENVMVTPDRRNATCEAPVLTDMIPSIPGEETEVTMCTDTVGNRFGEMHYNGKLYGYLIDSDGKEPMDFALVDMFGTGKHFSQFRAETGVLAPDWLTDGE